MATYGPGTGIPGACGCCVPPTCSCCGCSCETWRARIANVTSGPFGGPFTPVDIFNVTTGTGSKNLDGSLCEHASDPGETLLAELGSDGSGLWLEVSEWVVQCFTDVTPTVGINDCYGTGTFVGRLFNGGGDFPGTMERDPGRLYTENCSPLLIVAPVRFSFAGGIVKFDIEYICDD